MVKINCLISSFAKFVVLFHINEKKQASFILKGELYFIRYSSVQASDFIGLEEPGNLLSEVPNDMEFKQTHRGNGIENVSSKYEFILF